MHFASATPLYPFNPILKNANVVISGCFVTGIHQRPDLSLKTTLLSNFTGTIHHSGEFKDFYGGHENKRVMIIGGGETASDILVSWYPHCKQIIWCIPRGQHFFRKYSKILPNRKPQALDKASSRALKLIAPHTKSKPGKSVIKSRLKSYVNKMKTRKD